MTGHGHDAGDPPGRRYRAPQEAARLVVWLAVVAGVLGAIAAVAIVLLFAKVGTAADRANQAIERIDEGRRVGILASCAATSAVIDAGRAVITGGSSGVPPQLAQFLEQHGYPPKGVREKQAQQAARDYGRAIARRVEDASGVRGLVEPNGRLDCRRLASVARGRN